MKKILICVALVGIMVSCGPQSVKQQEVKTTNLEKFVDDFMARYPKGLDNDAQKEKMNEAFKKDVKDSLSNSS